MPSGVCARGQRRCFLTTIKRGLIVRVGALGLGPLSVLEVEDKKNLGMSAEAVLLDRVIPKGAVICAMDERGTVMTSPKFAYKLGDWRDAGRSDLALIIGGADGIDP